MGHSAKLVLLYFVLKCVIFLLNIMMLILFYFYLSNILNAGPLLYL